MACLVDDPGRGPSCYYHTHHQTPPPRHYLGTLSPRCAPVPGPLPLCSDGRILPFPLLPPRRRRSALPPTYFPESPRTLRLLPPVWPTTYRPYDLLPTAYRSSRLPPTAYRLPPPAWVPVRTGLASVLRPHQISLRPAHRDPGCLPCSRLWVGPSAYTLCSCTAQASSPMPGMPPCQHGVSPL